MAGATVGIALLAAVFAVGARYGADRVRARDEWIGGQLLSTAIDSVRANALDSLPSEELIRRAVSGMLRELHDPYAALLRPEGYKSYRGALLGESQGMGMSLRLQGALLSVRRVVRGSPAATAGVRRGDRVLEWNGVPITDSRLRAGADSSRVQGNHTELLLWRAPLGDSIRVTVHRATWHSPAVTEAGLLSDSVGYVRLASITQHATAELEGAVTALTRRGARSLVLDLRGNGGGLFEEGVNAAALFLPPNVIVASLAGRGGSKPQVYRAHGSRWPTMPLTVLVDAGTASAAEVIAAALREHDRALLVGAPTYGKGVVQRVVRLSPELSLRLTTARWLTPTGRTLERRQGTGSAATGGMQPDVLLDDAAWRDPSGVPRDWPSTTIGSLVAAADLVAMTGLREKGGRPRRWRRSSHAYGSSCPRRFRAA
ncbi:MAG: PDZ domain-containing protein [Gemmatimonadaceae bacterium]|nr:PDZ domain-containing protein [Gemmatimonadaceae bacterium]